MVNYLYFLFFKEGTLILHSFLLFKNDNYKNNKLNGQNYWDTCTLHDRHFYALIPSVSIYHIDAYFVKVLSHNRKDESERIHSKS